MVNYIMNKIFENLQLLKVFVECEKQGEKVCGQMECIKKGKENNSFFPPFPFFFVAFS